MTTIRDQLTPEQLIYALFGRQHLEHQMTITNETTADIETETVGPEVFSRKTFDVEGIQVNEHNMDAIASWCGGQVFAHKATPARVAQEYIEVPVKRPLNDRQKQAHVGDWVLKAKTGFKVYTDKAMKGCFELKKGVV